MRVGVGQRVNVGVGVIELIGVGQRVIVGDGVIGVAGGRRVMVGIGVPVGCTVPGRDVEVGVSLGVSVFEGVRDCVGVNVGVGVSVGARVLDGVGVNVAVEGGGFPIMVKKST